MGGWEDLASWTNGKCSTVRPETPHHVLHNHFLSTNSNSTHYSSRSIATLPLISMVNYYDELEIEDFAWDPVANVFHYPCPCGDRFEISKSQLRDGEEIAICPSCSLIVRVIYDYVSATRNYSD